MPSLNDIPLQLRAEPNKISFMRWLASLPVDLNHKRSLASLWQRDTDIKLTKTDWQILNTSTLMNPPANATPLPTSTQGR